MPRLRLLLTCVATLLLPALTSAITVNHSSGYQQDGQSNSSSEDFTNSSQVWHGSGLATDGGAEGSVLGIALGSLWERVRPYIFQDTAKLADRLTAFRQRMLTKAEDAVNVYTSAAATRFPVPGRQRFARRLESVGDATSEGGWTRQRVKREALHDIFNYKDPDGLPILSKIEGLLDLGVRGSRSIEMTQWNGRLIVAVIDAAMNVSIYAVDEQIRQVHHTARLKGDHKCDFCRVGLGRLLLVCITVGEPDPYQGFFSGEDTLDEVTVYLVDEEAPGQGRLHLNFLQTIPTPSPRYVDIWTQQHKTYLAVINAEVTVTNGMSGGHAGYGTYKNYHTTSRLYRWTGLYFDIVQELPGTNPRAVHYFIASKFFFLAVANFRNNKGQHNCDSVIYRYSVDMNRYVPFQQILTKGATHFESFTLGVDPRKNTFLAVANFCEDDEFGNCNPYTTSRIYQYHLGKFVLFQEIPTNHAIQWLAVQVEDTVLLAVASSVTGIKFYQYNGWRFTPTELQRAEGPFGVGVTSMSAVTWNGVVIMGVSNEDDGRSSNEPTLYTISFRTDKTLQEFYEATEKRCQDLLKGAREQDVDILLQQLETNPMITGPHAFTVPVVIKGNLTVLSPSEVSQVHVRSTGELFPATLHGVQQKIEALEQELGGAWRRFVNTIPINSPITWPDDLHFSHLIIGSAGVSSVSDLRAVRVNGQLIPAVDDLVRLEELSRVHLGTMRFTQIDSQSATFVESLQGHPVSSYVTLSGQHTISGETTFLDVLWTPRVHAASSLDGVHVATDSILLTTTVQNHTGSLACGTLEVDSLQVNTINDINIDHLLQSLVTRDAAASITGHVRILGDLIYPGNLEVNLTSSVDLINPLRTDDKNLQLVTGQHRVESVRSQSVRVAGRVNSVRVPEDVFLRRAGHSYTVQSAAFTQVLASSVAISTALDTITVQDNQLAVLKVRGDQVVTASKTFSSIHLLQDDLYSSYSTSGGRRRRDTSGSSEQSCGLFDSSSRDLTEAQARREALMWGVRSVAVAEDLLSILDASEPNMLTRLQHNAQFFSRLAQDVPCAFPYRGYEVLFSDILGSDWRDEDNMTVTFTMEDIERSLDTIEKHVRNVTEELSHLHLEWQDVLSVYIDAKRNMKSDDESLLITELLKILFDENIRHNYTRSDDTEDCRMICSVGHQGTTDFAQREENCGTAISLIQKVLRRITGYPSIIQNMALVSGFKSRALQTAVVEHDLGKLLQVIKDEAGLQQALSAAVQCQVAPARRTDNREVVRMLTSYGREQRKFAVFTFGGNNRIAVPGPTRVSADSVPSSLPADLPRPRAAGRVTPEDMGHIEGSLSASRSGSLTPLKQTKSLPVDVVEVSSTDGHSPAESDGPNSSAGIEFETIGMEKTESLGSLTNTSDMGKLHAGGSDETKGLSRRTRGVSDPSEAVESFISVLQSYLDDIKENRGDVSIVVSKWNGRDLISEFNEMEKVFYQNPETITDDAERKILILHKLVDDIKNAVMAFEDSERKVASQARLKSSEPQMEEDVEGNASAMERNDVFSDPVVESPLTPGSTPGETAAEGTTISATKEESNIEDSTGEEPLTENVHLGNRLHDNAHVSDDQDGGKDKNTAPVGSLESTHSSSDYIHADTFMTELPTKQSEKSNVNSKDVLTVTKQFDYTTASYLMHLTTFINCIECTFLVPSVDQDSVSNTVIVLATSTTLPGQETLGLLATEGEDIVNGTSKSLQKRDIDADSYNANTINIMAEKPHNLSAGMLGNVSDLFSYGIPLEHLGPPLSPSYSTPIDSGNDATRTLHSATFVVEVDRPPTETESVYRQDSQPVDEVQFVSGGNETAPREVTCSSGNVHHIVISDEVPSDVSSPKAASDSMTTLYIGKPHDRGILVNIVKEYHYTTATTHLKHHTTYIDCTSCIFVHPSAGVEAKAIFQMVGGTSLSWTSGLKMATKSDCVHTTTVTKVCQFTSVSGPHLDTTDMTTGVASPVFVDYASLPLASRSPAVPISNRHVWYVTDHPAPSAGEPDTTLYTGRSSSPSVIPLYRYPGEPSLQTEMWVDTLPATEVEGFQPSGSIVEGSPPAEPSEETPPATEVEGFPATEPRVKGFSLWEISAETTTLEEESLPSMDPSTETSTGLSVETYPITEVEALTPRGTPIEYFTSEPSRESNIPGEPPVETYRHIELPWEIYTTTEAPTETYPITEVEALTPRESPIGYFTTESSTESNIPGEPPVETYRHIKLPWEIYTTTEAHEEIYPITEVEALTPGGHSIEVHSTTETSTENIIPGEPPRETYPYIKLPWEIYPTIEPTTEAYPTTEPTTETYPTTEPTTETYPTTEAYPTTESTTETYPTTEPATETIPPSNYDFVALRYPEPDPYEVPHTRPIPVPPSGHSCRHIPLYYYEEFEHLNHTILQLLIADEYLQSLQSTKPWDLETAPWVDDEGVASFLRQAIERVNGTVFQLVHNTLPAVHTLDIQTLEAEAQNFNIGLTFGLMTELSFSKEFIRKLEHLDHLVAAGRRSVSEALLCLKDTWKDFMSRASSGDGRTPSPPYTAASAASRPTGARLVPEWYTTTEISLTTEVVSTTTETSTTTEVTTTEETPTTSDISTTFEVTSTEISTTTEVTTNGVTATEETPTTNEITTTDEIPTTSGFIVEPLPTFMPTTTDESSTTEETTTTPSITVDTSEVMTSTTLEESFATPEEPLTTRITDSEPTEISSTTDESLPPTEEATKHFLIDPIPTVEMLLTFVPVTPMASDEDTSTPPDIFDDWFHLEESSATEDDADAQKNDTGSNPWESVVGMKPDYSPRIADTTAGDLNDPFCIYPNSATPRLSGPRRRLYGSWVKGRVAGYRLEDFVRSSTGRFKPGRDHINYIAANLVRVRNLAFRAGLSVETVNGVDVLRVEKRGLLLSATSFRSSMIFAQSVVVDGDVRAANINGVLASAYVTLSDPFVLSRPMAFQNAVSVSGRVAVVSTVNKVDLQAFSRSVALTTAASQVFSSVAFVSVAAQSVECEVGQVAGVLVSDWVLLNQTAVITGRKTFLEVTVREEKVQVGRLTADLINDVNVNSFFLDSLRKNPAGPQVVHGNMQLKQLVVEQELTTQGFTLTRLPTRQTTVVDLKRLSRKVVYKDQTSTISGGILLNGGASVSTLNFFDSFDGVPATRYDEGWLLKSSPQTIIGHLTLPSMTAGDVLIVPGVKVQGVDILNLKNTTAMVDEPVVISSSVRFAEMVSLSEVYVAGLVQGWDLSEDGILQNSSSVVFTSSKTFLSSISISQRFQAVRGISGLDLDALCRQIQVDSLTIIGTVRLAARVTAGIVQVEDHVISGESVTDYWLTDQSILLPQPVALQEVFANHVVVKGTINGVDLVSLSTRLLQNTCRDWQVLTGRLSINELAAYTLSTPEVLARTLNGHPVTDLSNIFTLDGDQVIRGHWIIRSVHVFGNVESTDLVNGMRMTDLCQLRRPCVIHATKTFSEDVVVLGHHYVQDDRTVQGVDVSEAFKYIVSRTSCGEIPGVTTFSGGLALSSILVHGLVDGVKVTADDLLTRSGNQVMTGLLVITYRGGDVVTAKHITAADGLFNGLDLTLLNQVFRLDVANTVKSPVVFLIGVVFRDLSYGPHVKSTNKPLIDLSDLRRCASAYESLYNLGSRNYWAVKNQFRELWGWRRVQKFEGTTKRIQPLRMDDVEDGSSGMAPSYSQYLAVIPKFGNTRILVYSATKDQYQDLNIVVSGRCIRNVVGYRTRQYDYVVTGHACQYLTQATYGANYTSLAVQPDQMLQVWKITSQALLVGNIPIRGAADVQVLRLRGVLCLVVVEAWGPDTVILCEQGPDNFVEHQRLPTGDPRKVAVAHHRGPLGRMGTFLVVAGWGYTPQEHSAFTVWTYDAEVDLFLLMQSVSFDNVEWVEMVSHGEDLFLVVVSKGFRGEVKGEVDIYRMDWFSDDDYTPFAHFGAVHHSDVYDKIISPAPSPRFVLMQELAVKWPLEAHFAALPSGELYLYVIDNDGYISWFSQKGIHKFWKEGDLHVPKKQTMDVWVDVFGQRFSHKISVAGDFCSEEDEAVPEPAEVLEANFRPSPYIKY